MSDAALSYSGVDNLEVMAEAVNYNAFLQNLVAAALADGDAVVDFGAGAGALAVPLAAAGYRVTCVEPDPALRVRLIESGLAAFASLAAIPPESLDAAYAVNVLEHVEDDAGAIAALRSKLKPGGKIIVYVPAFQCLYTSMDRKVGHLRRYRRSGLRDLVGQTGMIVECVSYRDCLGFFAALLFRLVDRGAGTINRRGLVAYDRHVFPLSRRLDRWCGRWFGKNLVVVARRDG